MQLLTRDRLDSTANARWKNVRASSVIYTLSHEWWVAHVTGRMAPHSRYSSLLYCLQNNTRPAPATLQSWTGHELNIIMSDIEGAKYRGALCPLLHLVVNYKIDTQNLQTNMAYPRRLGFVPKRFAVWQLLVLLKMWHHLVLVLWWSLNVFRLTYRRKNAYSFFNSCGFNVYCCLILALAVYSLSMFQKLELFFKFKPGMLNIHRSMLYLHESLTMIFRCACYSRG
jgi:hypothetical protein